MRSVVVASGRTRKAIMMWVAMRDNGLITNREVELKDGDMLVSRTDPGGRITFVNQQFIEISGYSEQELLGSPHNLVRHPHMPKEAFADLWRVIKEGCPWEGFVKNRTENGDHYWVRANVTPFMENGMVAGYISIRSKPTRAQVNAAEAAYAAIRDGKGTGLRVEEGQAVSSSASAKISQYLGRVRGRLAGMVFLLTVMMLALSVTTLRGMNDSNDALRTVYDDRVMPMGQLSEISDLMRQNKLAILEEGMALQTGGKGAGAQEKVNANIGRISKIWAEYMATYLTPEEGGGAKRYAEERKLLVEQGFLPALALIDKRDKDGLSRHYHDVITPLFDKAHPLSQQLIALQLRVAADHYAEATIENISELSSAIAAAVEEQGAATNEIARSVEQAAHGTASAAENVQVVAGAAEETKLMSDQVYDAANGLQGASNQLAQEVAGFIKEIRNA